MFAGQNLHVENVAVLADVAERLQITLVLGVLWRRPRGLPG